jgi:type II secretory pathway pseudopilin PulG
MNVSMAHARSLRSESGFAIIEAVVSAAVLAVVAMAILAGVDAASHSSGREKARAVAASLAEQEQERLRSLSVNDLNAIAAKTYSRTVPVDGANYTVTSKARWITDDQGGTPSCGNSSKNNEYLHVTTTVTSAYVGRNVDPVRINSIVAPSLEYSSTHGILGVKVVDRNGVGVPNVPVSIASTSPAFSAGPQNTDPDGCVIFRQVPVATYTIKVDKVAFAGTGLMQVATASQKASPGNVTFKTIDYDYATTARLTVRTTKPGDTSTVVDSKAAKLTLTNAKLTGQKRTYDASANSSVTDITTLFPFKATNYAFFTGSCASESPDTYVSNYFGANPGSLLMDPTKPQPQTTTVLQPAFNVRITTFSRSSATFAGAWAKLVPGDDGCGEASVPMVVTTWPNPAGAWGAAPGGNTTGWLSKSGAAYDPGMPFGKYTICVMDSRGQFKSFPYDNTKLATPAAWDQGTWSGTDCR